MILPVFLSGFLVLIALVSGCNGQRQLWPPTGRNGANDSMRLPSGPLSPQSSAKFLSSTSGSSQANKQQHHQMRQSFARNLHQISPASRMHHPAGQQRQPGEPTKLRAATTVSQQQQSYRHHQSGRQSAVPRLPVAERRDSSQVSVASNLVDSNLQGHQPKQQKQQQLHQATPASKSQNQRQPNNHRGRLLVCYYTTRQSAPYWPNGAQEFFIPADKVVPASSIRALNGDEGRLVQPLEPMLHYEPYPSASELKTSIQNELQVPAKPLSAAQVELEFSSSPLVQGKAGAHLASSQFKQQARLVLASPSVKYSNGNNRHLVASALKPANDIDSGSLGGEQAQFLQPIIMSPTVSLKAFGNNGPAESAAASFASSNSKTPPPSVIMMMDHTDGPKSDQTMANNDGNPFSQNDHPTRASAATTTSGTTMMMMVKQQPQQLIFAPSMSQRTFANTNNESGPLAVDLNSATTATVASSGPTSPPPPGAALNDHADVTSKQHLFVPSPYKSVISSNKLQQQQQQQQQRLWPGAMQTTIESGPVGFAAPSPQLNYRNVNQQPLSTTLSNGNGNNQPSVVGQQQQQQQYQAAAGAVNQRASSAGSGLVSAKFSGSAANNLVKFPSSSSSSLSAPFVAAPSTIAAAISASSATETLATTALNVNENELTNGSKMNAHLQHPSLKAHGRVATTPNTPTPTTTAPIMAAGVIHQARQQQQSQLQAASSLAPPEAQSSSSAIYQQLASSSTRLPASSGAGFAGSGPLATNQLLSSFVNPLQPQSSPASSVGQAHSASGLTTALVSSPLSTMFDVFGAASHYLMRFKPSSLMSPSTYSSFNSIVSEPINGNSYNGDSLQQTGPQLPIGQAVKNSSLLGTISLPFSSGLLGSVHKPMVSVIGPNDRSSSSSASSGGPSNMVGSFLSRLSSQTNQRREDVCGRTIQTPERRIIGGEGARYGEFPYQVHIKIAKHQCGGALVDRQSIITAAHCVYHFITRAPVSKLQIVIGAYDIEDEQYQELPPQYFKVNKVKLHPNFRFSASHPDRYDIAILKLDKPVKYTDNVLPVCLPGKDLKFESMIGTVTGFGKTDPSLSNRYGTRLLQKVDVPIIENNECERWHRTRGIDLKIFPEMMCAGYEDGLKDACVGDSGGPLVVKTPIGGPDGGSFRWTLAGITSAGFGCAQSRQPGIYHRVSHTVDWILENLD